MWIEEISDFRCPRCKKTSEYATDFCPNCGTNLLQHIDEPIVYDGFNGQVRSDSTTIGTITRNVGADLKRNGQGIIEPKINVVGNYSQSNHDASRIVDAYGLAPTFKENHGTITAIAEPKEVDFRVRKLTERECFRLQGVKDEDFAKIRQNQSVSSCYHLAGDSITTSVLMALFGQMLGVDWRSKVDELVEDLQEKQKGNKHNGYQRI